MSKNSNPILFGHDVVVLVGLCYKIFRKKPSLLQLVTAFTKLFASYLGGEWIFI